MGTMTVGILNVLLKVAVLSCVAVCAMLVGRCLKLLMRIRLVKMGATPFVFPTDGTIFKVRSSARRFGSLAFLGFGALVLIGLSILPAEIVADFGVDSSNKCRPEKEETYGICGGIRIDTRNSRSKLLSTAFSVENLEWNNQDLVNNAIRQGFHKNCDGREYFGDGNEFRNKRNLSLPIAISGCYASNARIIQPKGTLLTFGSSSYVNEGISLTLIESTNRTFSGVGGVFHNYAYHSAFMVVEQPNAEDHSSSAIVIEYSDSEHLKSVSNSYSLTSRSDLRVKAKGALYSYEVGCRVSLR